MIADHSMLKEIKIADIRVGSRHRRDMGDLTTLADSIRQEGLLQPIGVTDRLELVFGERRIRAGFPSPQPLSWPTPTPTSRTASSERGE